MSEEKKILGDLPNVEFQDAVDFFASRKTRECPICGHNQWSVFTSIDAASGPTGTGLASIDLTTMAPMNFSRAAVTAICTKCAFLRLHGLVEIAKWVKAGKPEFVADE
jgi:hypothetical protein